MNFDSIYLATGWVDLVGPKCELFAFPLFFRRWERSKIDHLGGTSQCPEESTICPRRASRKKRSKKAAHGNVLMRQDILVVLLVPLSRGVKIQDSASRMILIFGDEVTSECLARIGGALIAARWLFGDVSITRPKEGRVVVQHFLNFQNSSTNLSLPAKFSS